MLFEIGQFKLDVDVSKTKHFYDTADRVSKSCSCDGCLNFEKAVDFLSPAVRTLFAKLGVDMKKIRECYVNCTNKDGTLLYGGFYHICGTILDGKGGWVKKTTTMLIGIVIVRFVLIRILRFRSTKSMIYWKKIFRYLLFSLIFRRTSLGC